MPSVQTFFEHFKSVNSSNIDEDITLEPDEGDYDPHILNAEICNQELIEAIACLKRNKSTGLDNVENDHIIDSLEHTAPLLIEYFNLVLSTLYRYYS